MSLTDQKVLDKNVEELICKNKINKSKKQDEICQEFTLREYSWNPLAIAKRANILEKPFLENIYEEKITSLLKKY